MNLSRSFSRALAGAAFALGAASLPAADYTITVSGGSPGNFVYPTMFGTNIVYSAVTVAQWPTFISTFNALGMTTLRYPGGTVTEGDFDFKDSNGPADDAISLTMFLQAVEANNITPLLVVPTKRFSANYATTGVQYAKDFVKAVNIDHGVTGGEQFGTTQTVQLWELGNEFYASSAGGSLTPTNYGKIANKFGLGMQTIDATVMPIVQFERSDAAGAATIYNQLTAGAVKGSVTHAYPTSDAAIATIAPQINAGEAALHQDAMVTEWNMGSDSVVGGLQQANYLPKIFRALVNAGVTISTQWPLFWHNDSVNTVLADHTGTLRPPGQVFQWLSQVAQNRKIVPTSASSSAIDCVAFKDGGAGKLSILVLCGASMSNAQVAITVNGFSGSHVVSAKRFYAAGGAGTETADTPATQVNLSPAQNGNVFTITTNKFTSQEVIRIDLSQ